MPFRKNELDVRYPYVLGLSTPSPRETAAANPAPHRSHDARHPFLSPPSGTLDTVGTTSVRIRALGARDLSRCQRAIHLDHSPTHTTVPVAAPAAFARRATLAADQQRTIWARLPNPLDPHPGDDHPTLFATWIANTETAVADDAPIIVRANPGHVDGRKGTIDALIRTTDGYRPVTIRAHRTLAGPKKTETVTVADPTAPLTAITRPGRLHSSDSVRGDIARLAHLRHMLVRLGWTDPDDHTVGIVGTEGLIVWHDLSAKDTMTHADRYATARAVAVAAATGAPALAQATFTSECGTCRWEQVCVPELEAAEHPSLLAGVGPATVKSLVAAGADTITKVAELDPALVGAREQKAVVQARAVVQGCGVLYDPATPLELPRTDIEIDIDLEDDGTHPYLWGMLVTDRTADTSIYEAHATWSGDPTPTLASLIDALTATIADAAAAGKTVAVYHYANHERSWLDRLGVADPPGTWVDVHAALGPVALPAGSKGLKDVAALAGYTWADDTPNGELSMAWYEEATGTDPAVAAAAQARLLRYNEDDVRACLAVRDWLSGPAFARCRI